MDSWERFQKFVQRFGIVGGLAVGGSTLVPLVTAAAGFSPPEPDGVQFITTLFMLLSLILTFLLVGSVRARTSTALIVLATIVTAGSFIYYSELRRTFVYEDAPEGELLTLGCTWTPSARNASEQTIADQCPGDPAFYEQALDEAGYVPTEIWTSASIRSIERYLFLTWLAAFVSLAIVIAAFVVRLTPAEKTSAPTRTDGASPDGPPPS